MSYVGKTKQSMRQRMYVHKNPTSKCTGAQLFAMGDPEWDILEIVESEHAGEREDWHIANTRAATNVNDNSVPLAGAALRRRQANRIYAVRYPEKKRQNARTQYHANNAKAVALGYKNNYQRLKAERIAAGFII